MPELSRSQRSWITFAGCVLIAAVLYFAQAVLMPIALAILVSFVLGPLVVRLQRWIGRVPAVLATVVLGFTALGLVSWGLGTQLMNLTADLPGYRANIRQKIADVRRAGQDSPVKNVQEAIEDIKTEIEKTGEAAAPPEPEVVRPLPVENDSALPTWLGPVIEPLTTAGLVITMVIFMLLNRDDLRGRLIRLLGRGHLAVTTRAIEEVWTRISRQLLMQSLVNLIYGLGVGIGLQVIGVPYAPLWGSLAAVVRFVPYAGAFVGATIPTLVAVAALPGWGPALWVVGLFIGLELFTNLVLETVLYAKAAGISQVALLVSLAFWTWLWGPMGLLMAMPLTVCLVVLGKHVSGLEFLATLMADDDALAPDTSYYQRLLAHDSSEASDIVERHLATQPHETVYDALLLPALNYAARDRMSDRLSEDEESAVVQATRELMQDLEPEEPAARVGSAGGERASVLGVPTGTESDDLALEMLEQLLRPTGLQLDIRSGPTLPSDLIRAVKEAGHSIVCIADLPPKPSSRTRYLIKKLRSAFPDIRIVVGRWAPPALADDRAQELLDAGADHVASTLVDTRNELGESIRLVPPARPARIAAGFRKP